MMMERVVHFGSFYFGKLFGQGVWISCKESLHEMLLQQRLGLGL